MGDLRELYQELILDHGRKPRNFHALAGADRTAEGHNPLCGDRLTLFLKLREGKIEAASFEGSGCAISMAAASMLTQVVTGATADEAECKFRDFHDLVTGRLDPEAAATRLGKLVAFAGVRDFPVRVKCATLPWHTLRAALARQPQAVSTE